MSMQTDSAKKNEPLNWWESKRPYFNLFVLISIGVVHLRNTTSTQELSIIDSLIWLFGANIFYTMSWVFELLFFRLFDKYPINKTLRYSLLIVGILFSMWWTLRAL